MFRLLRSAILGALLLTLPSFAQDWWDTDWSGRLSITADSSLVSGTSDLTDFTAWYDLSDIASGDTFWTTVASDGADIRMTAADGTTQLPCKVLAIDTGAKTGWLIFEQTQDYNDDTVAYIYYGNGSATEPADTDTYGHQEALSKYGMVYHMDGSSATNITDGTANDIDVDSDNNTPDYQQTGKIHYAVDFLDTAGTEYLTIDDAFTTPALTSRLMISSWVNLNRTSGNKSIVELHKSGTSGATFHLLGDDPRLQIYIGGWKSAYIAQSLSTGTWYHIACYYDGTNMRVFVDGSQVYTGAQSGSITMTSSNDSHIGDGSFYPDQLMDEILISDDADTCTNDWIITIYNNQSDAKTFFTTGSHEDAPASSTVLPVIIWQ